MNVDAQEAALGLLSMGHNYFSQPTPSTSSATLNSILTTTASPVIPQKRKQSALDQQESPHRGNHDQYAQHEHYMHLTHSPPPEPSPRSNGAECNDQDGNDTSTEAVDCICGFAVDDGFSIACDKCSRWCHSACFGIAPGGVPDKFVCWTCQPRSAVEKEKAVRLQRERLGMDPAADGGERDPKEAKHRRRSSPGSDRKQRRAPNTVSGAVVADSAGPGKRKRRPSIMQQPPTPILNPPTLNGGTEEEQVDVDNEPWREAYVHIAQDIIPSDDTRAKLRRQAAHWRGVTAVSAMPSLDNPAVVPSSSLDTSPPVSIKPLTPQSSLNPFLFQNSNPLVLPPAFSLHTTQPIPSHALITPFRSCITPSSSYLADPLNAYAHLGMPKPYVHLMGPPLDLALDARLVGNQGRFARWGCRPNAVLRPVLCERGPKDSDDDTTLAFGVFAIRDLKANEEIILGWEWDDGNAVHSLPALLEAHDAFPVASASTITRPNEIQHLKNQMSNILHGLSSTFTTCACGARARECALTQMAAFVDGHPIGCGKERSTAHDSDDEPDRVDVGPLVGRKRGFRTRERIPFSGGLGGMEMVIDEDESGSGRGVVWDKKRAYQRSGLLPPPPSFVISPSSPTLSKKGKEKAVVVDDDVEMIESSAAAGIVAQSGKQSVISINNLVTPLSPHAKSSRHPLSEPRPPDPRDAGGGEAVDFDVPEDRLPPKMRKKWMHRELEARKECTRVENEVSRVGLGITFDSQDEQLLMPPPPMPASMDPTTISSTTATLKSSSATSLNFHIPNHLPPSQRSLHETPPSTVSPPSSESPGLSLPKDPNVGPMSPSLSFSKCPTSTPSALASFANLSLLSPDLNFLGPCQQSQHPQSKVDMNERSCLASIAAQTTKAEHPICKAAAGNEEQSSLSIAGRNVGTELEDGELEFKESCVRKDGDMMTGSLAPSSSAELGVVPASPPHNEDDEDDYSPLSPETDRTVPYTSNLPGPISADNTPSKPLELLNSPSQKEESELAPTSPLVAEPQLTPQTPPPTVDFSTASFATTSGSTPITGPTEVTPEQPISPTSDPEPKPLQKVKMSLKDFALRKKKQREEMALSQTSQASPVIASPSLPDANGHERASLETDKSAIIDGQGSGQKTDEGCTTLWSPQQAKNTVKTDPNGAIGSPLAEESTEARIKVDSRTLTTTLNERGEDTKISPTAPFAHSMRISLVPNSNGYAPTSILPNPLLLPARQSQDASIQSTTKTSVREMKQESLEPSVPSLLRRVSGIEYDRSVSPISPDPAPLAGRVSQEDGEIGEIITTSRTTPSFASKDATVLPRPLSRTGPPFSHSPPTGPRSLAHPSTSPSSVRPSTSAPAVSNNGSSSRLAPTAPRALRQSLMQHHRPGSGPPSHSPSIPPPSSNPNGGSQYIPRGPSADRDRERDRERDRMDWDQRHYRGPPPPPRWASSNGRGNLWGR